MKKLFLILAFFLFSPLVHADCNYQSTSGTSGEASFGDVDAAGGRVQEGQLVVPGCSGNLTQAVIYMKYLGSAPADQLYLLLEATSGNKPTNVVLATSNNVTINTTTCTPYTFTFASPYNVTSSTNYETIFQRTGSASNSDYYQPCGSDPTPSSMNWNTTFGGTWNDWTTTAQSTNVTISVQTITAIVIPTFQQIMDWF